MKNTARSAPLRKPPGSGRFGKSVRLYAQLHAARGGLTSGASARPCVSNPMVESHSGDNACVLINLLEPRSFAVFIPTAITPSLPHLQKKDPGPSSSCIRPLQPLSYFDRTHLSCFEILTTGKIESDAPAGESQQSRIITSRLFIRPIRNRLYPTLPIIARGISYNYSPPVLGLADRPLNVDPNYLRVSNTRSYVCFIHPRHLSRRSLGAGGSVLPVAL